MYVHVSNLFQTNLEKKRKKERIRGDEKENGIENENGSEIRTAQETENVIENATAVEIEKETGTERTERGREIVTVVARETDREIVTQIDPAITCATGPTTESGTVTDHVEKTAGKHPLQPMCPTGRTLHAPPHRTHPPEWTSLPCFRLCTPRPI